MADKNSKRYCVIDHADKLGDRSGANPNRVRRVKAARFRALELQVADVREQKKRKGR